MEAETEAEAASFKKLEVEAEAEVEVLHTEAEAVKNSPFPLHWLPPSVSTTFHLIFSFSVSAINYFSPNVALFRV